MAYIGEGGVKQLAVLINNRYITADAVDEKIGNAVKDITGLKTEVVAVLPSTGVEGTIYFVPSSTVKDGNVYDEYLWLASQSKYEMVGSTQVELDDYAKTEDVPTKTSELTNDSGFSTYDPTNKDTLNKLSTSTDGNLLFDGNEIKGGTNDVGTVYRKETVLWSGSKANTGTITLSDDYDKYNELVFVCNSANDGQINIFNKSFLVDDIREKKTIRITQYASRFVNIEFTDTDKKTINITKNNAESSNGNTMLYRIVGITYSTDAESLDNIDTVRKLSESNDGKLLFDGNEISGSGSSTPTEVENMYVNIDRYTEDEIVIGEYMGKPLYRIVNYLSNLDIDNIKIITNEPSYISMNGYGSATASSAYSGYLASRVLIDNADMWCSSASNLNSESLYINLNQNIVFKNLTVQCQSPGSTYATVDSIDVYVKYTTSTDWEKATTLSVNSGVINITDNACDISNKLITAIRLTFNKSTTGYIYCRFVKINGSLNNNMVYEYTKTTDPENSFDKNSVLSTVKAHGIGYENYSEDEIVIGKWIDGRPLYSKIVSCTTPNVSRTSVKTYSLSAECQIKDINGFVDWGTQSGTACVPVNLSIDGAYFGVWASNLDDPNCVYINTTYVNRPAILILKYIKTTDVPNSFNPAMVESGYVADGNYTDAEVSSAVNNIFGGEN